MDCIIVAIVCGILGGIVGHAIDVWEESKFDSEI